MCTAYMQFASDNCDLITKALGLHTKTLIKLYIKTNMIWFWLVMRLLYQSVQEDGLKYTASPSLMILATYRYGTMVRTK